MTLKPCSRSGHCCQGRGRTVLTQQDICAISNHLKINQMDFIAEFCIKDSNAIYLKNRPFPERDACVFLNQKNECEIQTVKPKRCLDWPLWPKIRDSKENFTHAKDYCQMLGHLNHQEFKQLFSGL